MTREAPPRGSRLLLPGRVAAAGRRVPRSRWVRRFPHAPRCSSRGVWVLPVARTEARTHARCIFVPGCPVRWRVVPLWVLRATRPPRAAPRLAGTLGSALSSSSSGFHPRFINKLSSRTWRKKKPGDPVCSSSPRPTPGVLPEVPRPPRHRAGAALRSSPGWASGTVGHFPNSAKVTLCFPATPPDGRLCAASGSSVAPHLPLISSVARGSVLLSRSAR